MPAKYQHLTLALPAEVEHQSLTMLQEKLVKIGTQIVRHGRHVTLRLVEDALPKNFFREILSLIGGLRRSHPAPA